MHLFSIPRAATALVLTLFVFAGCGEDSRAPLEAGDDSASAADAESADLEPDGAPPATTDEDAGVPAWARSYEITLENLTPATGAGSSQPFSPPVLAVHRAGLRIFRVGRHASDELAMVAEDAVNGPLVGMLESSSRVSQVVEGGGVILPGDSDSWIVQGGRGSNRLSMVFMLVNTNDGFGGESSLRLPHHGEVVRYLYALDAGSEENTELAAHIPGPCCGSPGEGPDTHARIRPHAGILGIGDLDPDVWGWDGPVAKLTVRVLDPIYEIRVENLTADNGGGASQVFSPPVLATHLPFVRMFRVGRHATDELAALAEDGLTAPIVGLLEGCGFAASVVAGSGPVFPGTAATYEIETNRFARRLSLATMLVNSNDAFTGLDTVRLPAGGSARWYAGAYDAGSEENTELAAHIPGPCCGSPGAGVDTHEAIAHHAGILGVGDLEPDVDGWDDPVAMIAVTRIREIRTSERRAERIAGRSRATFPPCPSCRKSRRHGATSRRSWRGNA